MKWVFIAAGVLVAFAALIAMVGWSLPVKHVATRQRTLAASPDVVWKTITDIDAFPSWRSHVTSVERVGNTGPVTWIEHGSSGRITFSIDASDPPRRLVARIADPTLPFGGNWTYELAPAGNGTVLTITEHGEIYNPVFRAVARFVFGYEATMTAYLDALGKKVG
jgi:uncharacterized protein YndB with AHSA1/START domain